MRDLLAIPEERRFHEIIDGELVRRASPTVQHGQAQMRLGRKLEPYDRRERSGSPGGWLFAMEAEIVFEDDQVLRPDISGWLRERMPEAPNEFPARVRPDWIAEVLSASNRRNDVSRKKRVYHRTGVGHYWVIDPIDRVLFVHRWTPDGYLEVLAAEVGARIHAEPFEAVAFPLGYLFGDEPED